MSASPQQATAPRSVRFYGARPKSGFTHSVLEATRSLLRRTNSKTLGAFSRHLYTQAALRKGKHLREPIRALVSLCQPRDPLRRSRNLAPIDLVVPFVEKDLRSLELVIEHVVKNVRNPIEHVILITPRNREGTGPRFVRDESTDILNSILARRPLVEIRFDQDVLGTEILQELEERFGRGDRNAGWVTQQLIKFSAAVASTARASLILDADTLLLSPKTWLTSEGKQLLQVANEYHKDFMTHVFHYFQVPKKLKLSFVTHHQLMQTDVVREMFPHGARSLLDWWKSSTDSIGRDLGDYEAYGAFLAHHHPDRVAFGSFANLFSPHLTWFLEDLAASGSSTRALIPGYCSVSFHSWAQVDRAVRGD